MRNLDILLIFPPISVSERYHRNVGEVGGNLPPLGILSIAAVLEQNGFNVKVIDGPMSGLGIKEIAKRVAKEKPLLVGISSLTATFFKAVRLAKEIKRLSNIPILIGGHHATILPYEVMMEDCFDILVAGEGEITTLELVKEFKKNPDNASLKKIKGIYFRRNGKIMKTKPRQPIQNLDILPFPARHLVEMKKYKPLPLNYKRLPATNMVVIRGCPFSCTYCSNSAVFGKRIRAFSPERVIKEMLYLKEEYGVRELSFWDDNLTIDNKWLTNVCNLIIKEGLDITWSCYGRINTVNQKLLKKMRKAGCWNIFYGIEAGDQRLLDTIKKGITLRQIRKTIKWTKDAGIEARGSFMIALPGETPELARRTIDFAISLGLDYAQFCITTPFPGTELFKQAKNYGRLTKRYDRYHIWDPVFIPYGYKNKKQIEEIEREAMRRFYLRPLYIMKRIAKIRSLTDLKRNLKGLRIVLGFI